MLCNIPTLPTSPTPYHTLLQKVTELFIEIGCSANWSMWLASGILSAFYILITCAAYRILNNVVNPLLRKTTRKTPTHVDEILLRNEFLKWVWWLISTILLYHLILSAVVPYPTISQYVTVVMDIAIIGFGTKVLVELVKGVFLIVFDHQRIDEEAQRLREAEINDEEYEYVPSHSLKGLQQMICILIWGIGIILMLAVLFGRSPLLIVSGLGAGAAVLMLVFKDSILGVVAGVQLTAHDMLRPGDWIIAPSHGANGRVHEVTLATVKVINWDHSVVTIPPYQLVSNSFQNWRHMEQTGGRRVMRSFNIDMTTVRFMSEKEQAQYMDEPWASHCHKGEWVNLTVFRHYLKYYIGNLPTLKNHMLYMVRELQPTPQGLPIEIYFFTTSTSWEAYEQVQADVIDHILAIVNKFGLRLFQSPSGADFHKIHS